MPQDYGEQENEDLQLNYLADSDDQPQSAQAETFSQTKPMRADCRLHRRVGRMRGSASAQGRSGQLKRCVRVAISETY